MRFRYRTPSETTAKRLAEIIAPVVIKMLGSETVTLDVTGSQVTIEGINNIRLNTLRDCIQKLWKTIATVEESEGTELVVDGGFCF